MIALTVLSFASCKDTEGSIGDPIISNGQDRDSDIITGDDYVYHLPVIFHVFYSNSKQYIEYDRLKEILSNVNELYQGDVYNYQLDTIPSENLHIQFELDMQVLARDGIQLIVVDITLIKFIHIGENLFEAVIFDVLFAVAVEDMKDDRQMIDIIIACNDIAVAVLPVGYDRVADRAFGILA